MGEAGVVRRGGRSRNVSRRAWEANWSGGLDVVRHRCSGDFYLLESEMCGVEIESEFTKR